MILKLFVCGLFTCAISKCRPRSLGQNAPILFQLNRSRNDRVNRPSSVVHNFTFFLTNFWFDVDTSVNVLRAIFRQTFWKSSNLKYFFQLIRRFCAIYFKLPLGCFWNDIIKSCRRGNNDPMRRHFGKGLFVGERVTTCAANCENCSKNFDF